MIKRRFDDSWTLQVEKRDFVDFLVFPTFQVGRLTLKCAPLPGSRDVQEAF